MQGFIVGVIKLINFWEKSKLNVSVFTDKFPLFTDFLFCMPISSIMFELNL